MTSSAGLLPKPARAATRSSSRAPSSDTVVFDTDQAKLTPDSARRAYLLVSTRGGRPVQFADVFPKTADKRVDLFPAVLAEQGLYTYRPDPATERYPLALISPATEKTVSSTTIPADCSWRPVASRGFRGGTPPSRCTRAARRSSPRVLRCCPSMRGRTSSGVKRRGCWSAGSWCRSRTPISGTSSGQCGRRAGAPRARRPHSPRVCCCWQRRWSACGAGGPAPAVASDARARGVGFGEGPGRAGAPA